MRTILSVLIVVAALASVAPSSSGCSAAQKTAEGSAAACLGVDVTQGVEKDGGTIVGDIYSAAVTGGATLATLISQLISTFGEPAVKCASIVVDAVLGVAPAPAPGAGSAVELSVSDALKRQGRTALEAEMNNRGWTKR